jgi:hypothetical protein
MLSCAVVVAVLGIGVGMVGIRAGGGGSAHDGGFIAGRGAAASSCLRTTSQPIKPIASATTPVHARSTAARPHVRRHDWRNGSICGSSFDQARAGPAQRDAQHADLKFTYHPPARRPEILSRPRTPSPSRMAIIPNRVALQVYSQEGLCRSRFPAPGITGSTGS